MAGTQQPLESPTSEPEVEQFGWDFHKGPLLFALILTVIFYIAVFFLASIRAETDTSDLLKDKPVSLAAPLTPGHRV